MSITIEQRLRKARHEQTSHGHDWDIADVLPVVEEIVAEAGSLVPAGSNEEWYVRAAIHRGMAALRDLIEEATRIIEKYEALPDEPARGTVLEMSRNMRSYNQQMLSEMEQYIPERLR